jgi:3'-5' exoribonuclease
MKTKEKPRELNHIWIKDIKENDPVEGAYLVKTKATGQTRQGRPFLTLTLADKTGRVEARVWDKVEGLSARFKEGDVVEINGQGSTYRNQMQIQIQDLKRVDGAFDPAVFLETTARDTSQMLSELKALAARIQNRHLRDLVEIFLTDHGFISRFKKAPAAKVFHHSYLGGLLEHTLSVSQMAAIAAEHYPELDGDLLLAGAILHDIGKIDELTFERTIDYSDQGRLLGHIVLGVEMLEEKLKVLKDFPPELAMRLKHLILSHHGEFDFGSPKRPKFLEAFALHLIDDLDAKINGLSRLLKEDKQEGSWTVFSKLFQRYLFKGDSSIPTIQKQEDKDEPGDQGQQQLFQVDY